MLHFANPIALTGLASLLIPLAIHLWSSRKGKILPVGSIALLEKTSSRRQKSIRLSQLLLLFLRCLLIIFLSLLLAGPVWYSSANSDTKGWIMVEKGQLPLTRQHFKSLIDSLTRIGYTLHYFDEGFEKATWSDSTQSNTPAAADSMAYWNLYSRLDRQLPPHTPVYLFTTGYLRHFSGPRPLTNRLVHWQTYTPATVAVSWIANATLTPSDSLCIITGNSDSTGIWYARQIVAPTAAAPFTITRKEDVWRVSRNNQPAVEADTSVLRITLFADNLLHDAAYVHAALTAIAGFTQRSIRITTISTPGNIPAQQDWLFWLSDRTYAFSGKAAHVFRYASGKAIAATSWINTGLPTGSARLFQRIAVTNQPAIPLWQDGFGNCILDCNPAAGQTMYTFYSRFNPAWNALPWSQQFPEWLLQLILPAAGSNIWKDQRIIDPQQVSPAIASTAIITGSNSESTDLAPLCWILLFALFFAERLLVMQPAKRRAYA